MGDRVKVIDGFQVTRDFFFGGFVHFFLDAVDDFLDLDRLFHGAIEPIDAGDIGTEIEAQSGSSRRNRATAGADTLSRRREGC